MRRQFKTINFDSRLALCWAAIGVLFAFPVVAELLDRKLLDSVATLWGSALGAIAAVSGAFWVADRQVAQQRKMAAALVRRMFYPTVFALNQLASLYGPPSRPYGSDTDLEADIFSAEKWQNIADHAKFVIDSHNVFVARIHRYEAVLNLLSADSLGTALALETELENAISDAVTPLKVRPHRFSLINDEMEYLDQAPTWGSRQNLAVFNANVSHYIAELEQQAS